MAMHHLKAVIVHQGSGTAAALVEHPRRSNCTNMILATTRRIPGSGESKYSFRMFKAQAPVGPTRPAQSIYSIFRSKPANHSELKDFLIAIPSLSHSFFDGRNSGAILRLLTNDTVPGR